MGANPVSRTHVGIDPGITGCLCLISAGGSVSFWDTPTNQIKVGKKTRAVYDVPAMIAILRDNLHKFGEVLVTIEELHAMPTNGGCGNFSSGYGYGLWIGLLAATGLPYQTVQPTRWKKLLGMKKVEGKDAAKKAADRMFACQLFPSASGRMNLVKHHGRADSLLIAEYGRRCANGVSSGAAGTPEILAMPTEISQYLQ